MKRNIILEILEEKKISLNNFSRMIGYDPSYVSKVSNRLLKMSFRMAYKISITFDYDLNEILLVEEIN